ncbi:MOSC domain-containing protein [bacterium]|nr:MOSC domain-containing protein [bacterium]
MAGIKMDSVALGWYGLLGDRRFAFRRVDDTSSGFPWLSASRLPALITYQPCDFDESSGELLPTRVRTPGGVQLDIRSEELRREIGDQFGSDVELMQLQQGIFDDAVISAITSATIARVCSEAEVAIDSRRFRPNIVLECSDCDPFAEDDWLGGLLVFGESEMAPAVHVTKRDLRCMMINIDPDTATQNAKVLKAAFRLNDNNAGVYGTVVRTGTVRAGDPVMIEDGHRYFGKAA